MSKLSLEIEARKDVQDWFKHCVWRRAIEITESKGRYNKDREFWLRHLIDYRDRRAGHELRIDKLANGYDQCVKINNN